jgi:hypothetical protein
MVSPMANVRRVMAIVGGGLAGACLGGGLSGYLWMHVQVLNFEGKIGWFFPDSLIVTFVATGFGLGLGAGLLIAALVPRDTPLGSAWR